MNSENDVVKLRPVEDDELQAADWLAKLDRGGLSSQERADFAKWLKREPANKNAIKEIASLWYSLNEPLSELRSASAKGRRITLLSEDRLTRFRRSNLGRGLVATACALVAFGVWLSAAEWTAGSNVAESYHATEIGETGNVTLDDGSTVELNTNTIIEVAYTHKDRVIRLVSGEAIFDVAHDENRPFLVYAAGGVIRAVGTRFAVRLDRDAVSVVVTEGEVAMAQRTNAHKIASISNLNPSDDSRVVFVNDGETADLVGLNPGTKSTVSEREQLERLSWADGQIVFFDRELQFVIDEVARYTKVRVLVIDDEIRQRRITGVLEIGDIESMLDGLENALNLEADRVSPDLIHIESSG